MSISCVNKAKGSDPDPKLMISDPDPDPKLIPYLILDPDSLEQILTDPR